MCLNHNCICFAVDHVEWRTDDESEAIRTLSWRYSRLDESDCGQDGQLSHCYLVMDNFRGPIWGWTDLTPALCDLLQPLQNAPPEQWSTSWWFCGLKILPTSSHYLRIATSHSKGPNEETSINVVARVLNTAQLKMARRFRQPRWIQFRLDRWKTSCAYLQLSCVDLNPSHARFFELVPSCLDLLPIPVIFHTKLMWRISKVAFGVKGSPNILELFQTHRKSK